ncbi:27975_t:CDS:1, partial [Dentiscutata erythropus]
KIVSTTTGVYIIYLLYKITTLSPNKFEIVSQKTLPSQWDLPTEQMINLLPNNFLFIEIC